jgi:molybdate transport system ATP-binding protein
MAAAAVTALDARIVVRRATFSLEVAFTVAPGATAVVVGRNGAGKSTLLDALAGLTPLDDGRIAVGEHVVDDVATGVFVPAERRPVGLVMQSAALFPHLSVLDNVAFGLRTADRSRASARATARDELDRFGLADFAARRPREISGGQAARVALARAMVRRPDLLLLDEPLAAVDAELRPALRDRLRADLAAFDGTALLVSHDSADAEALGDTVLVLDAGRLLQQGPLASLRAAPAAPIVSRLLG